VLVYLSYRRLLIRPLIPPTVCHPAFDTRLAGPHQRHPRRRGEIERTFGRRAIIGSLSGDA
jgi:hypothetical protein